MRIGLVGGTGKEGRGLAMRWARAGHEVIIGSRDAARAQESAAELTARAGVPIRGGDNLAAADTDVVVLSVPYGAQAATLTELRGALAGKIVLDLVVPLQPPQVTRVHVPDGKAAALEAQAILGDGARVVGALHHVSSTHLADLEHPMRGDVLVVGDDEAARGIVIGLCDDLGMRGLDAGPLVNAVALEAMTPVLLYMGKRYKRPGLGVTISGLPEGPVAVAAATPAERIDGKAPSGAKP
jgi:8-hydroxy-5-deazaflavin:NADPH oxidoreductase